MQRFGDLEKKYVLDVIDNSFQTSLNNVYTSKLEKKFSEVFNQKFSLTVCNGTATMHVALKALNIGEGDEVIVPPLTMSAPAIAVLLNGSIPVFADVEPDTFTIDAKSIEKCITPETKAVITVSLYGLAPNYDEIIKVCKKNNLYLIEDNAECFLGTYKGKLVGEFGDFSSYSFQASKHMTCGEGGMLTTNNEELADKARRLISLGYAGVNSKQAKISRQDIQDPQYNRHVSLGFNYRMSELQSAVALGQLERLSELVSQRKQVAEVFDNVVLKTDLLKRQYVPEDTVNSYWAYAMTINTPHPEKDWYRFRDLFLSEGGDGYYAAWKLSYQEPLFQTDVSSKKNVWQKYGAGLCPNAEILQPRMIQLKTNYWNLDEAEAQAQILAKTIEKFKHA